MYKEQEWSPYNKHRKVKIIELNLKDNNGQTVDFYKLQKEKTRDNKRILKIIKEKYGFDINKEIEQKIKSDKENLLFKKDLSW
jgi:hypothetical protein